MRLALGLMLQNPQLAADVTDDLPNSLDIPGFDLFSQVAARAKQDLNINPAALIDFWRDEKDYAVLVKLLQWEHNVPEKGLQQEFIGAIQKIKKACIDDIIDKLLSKAAQIGLSNDEKIHLNQLINSNKEVKV